MKNTHPLLLLVNPRQEVKQYASNIGFARLLGKKTGMTPLSLPYLAALTPENWRIRIIDEEVEPVPKNLRPALVAITAVTPNVKSAFSLADEFRQKGIPVVMGGPHVSIAVEEGLEHADCILIGEADLIWVEMLEDFRRGELKKRYQPSGPVEYRTPKFPRWDLVKTGQMAAIPVQASRGCPFSCEFCLVSELFGHEMRYREIDNLIAELESLPLKTVFFVDDNLTANKDYARQLMRRLKPLNIQWFCMASIEIAKFPDLLAEMADCGCLHILVGFESLNPASLSEANKGQNRAETYAEAIETIHRAGINVNGSFIVGFDHDQLNEFDRLHDFLLKTKVWYPNINILEVIPGTRLYDRIKLSGRWCDRPHEFSGGMFPVMHYQQMSQIELFEANQAFIKTIYSPADLRKRVVPLFATGWFAKSPPNRDVSPGRKFLMSLVLIKCYLFSADIEKRGLFLDLFTLFREGKLSVDKLVFCLVTVEGVLRLFHQNETHMQEWRSTINRLDRGPWMVQSQANTAGEASGPE